MDDEHYCDGRQDHADLAKVDPERARNAHATQAQEFEIENKDLEDIHDGLGRLLCELALPCQVYFTDVRASYGAIFVILIVRFWPNAISNLFL